MKLNYQKFGNSSNPIIIMMHGFLGSNRNWATIGKLLENEFLIYSLDLRNHGESGHSELGGYDEMAEDIREFINEHHLKKVILLGHSMGGKVAMKVACQYPELVSKIIIVDIAPKDYSPHRKEVEAMLNVKLADLKSKNEAEEILSETISDFGLRKFLMTNLIFEKEKGYFWRINLKGLTNNLNNLVGNPLSENERYIGPSYFIAGGRSNYIQNVDDVTIKNYFPTAEIITIEESDHNPHFSAREKFMDVLKNIL